MRKPCTAVRRHFDRAGSFAAPDPAELEEPVREGCAERAGDVELALAPVQAAADDRTAQLLEGRQIDAELPEPRAALGPSS